MDLILMKKVRGLGELGDKVSVRAGYGRNFLIPSGFAKPATADNLKAFDERRAELEREAADALAAAEARKAKLEGVIVTIPRKAGDEGRLFGSVGTADIAAAITEGGLGMELLKSEVRLPDGPFRAVGDYDVELHLHSDVAVTVRIEVIPAT
ncbi:50S ribosomal protein L9 [Lamprobacter modestohalophilus]|uniref:Large ribosomal subunit protein bL9 n=1 Tax=Lamprobacter modestohalophilus TaxID=1064514 RepID=A0A9X0WA54_9GAMM|nr:50S ribosomal protein L9 [Lamprobacter modestohalophilus]